MSETTIGFQGSSAIPGNGYSFRCPVVERDSAFTICARRRDKHWRGERTQAHDCHTAMNGSKCPALHMLTMEWAAGEEMFYDSQVRLHALPKAIIERIEKLVLVPSHAHGMELTAEQQELLFGGLREIPKTIAVPERAKRTRKAHTVAVPAESDVTDDIGAGADMSEMLNKAIAAT